MRLLKKIARKLLWRLMGIKGSDFLPEFHPAGVTFMTVEVAPGCFALLSDKPPVTNSGFVVGEDGVAVIDAHINGDMARQIQARVQEVTDRPIKYVVNTSYHGDHTFGNHAFPADTQIVAHRLTAKHMERFDDEYEVILERCRNDRDVLRDVTVRYPDVVFDDQIELDLGDRRCEVRHFGHGNSPGDATVWVPDAKVAFTGNFISGEGTLPVLFDGEARQCRDTLQRFMSALDVRRIVPGHSLPASLTREPPFDEMLASDQTLRRYSTYLDSLCEPLEEAVRNHVKLQQAFKQLPLPDEFLAQTQGKEAMQLRIWHRFNVARCYKFAASQAADA